MSSCCTPRGYRRVFSARSAERQARRYRSRGLDRTSRRIAAALLARGVEGATVLEAGGGVGALQVELLANFQQILGTSEGAQQVSGVYITGFVLQ